MTFENLQVVSQVAILAGVIITALGGYGSYHYGSKIQERKDLASSKTEEELGTKIQQLLDGNNTLQEQLKPFEELAAQIHPTLQGQEALSQLRKDLGSLQERAAALENQAAPRLLSDAQRQGFAAALQGHAQTEVTVNATLGDQEGVQFANHLKAMLEEAGWQVHGVNQVVYTNPIQGLWISVKANPPTPAAVMLINVLNAGGVPTKGQIAATQGEELAIIVGSKL